MMTKQTDAAKFKAGRETALDDARRGVTHAPLKSDDPSWAKGYRECCDDLASVLGSNWLTKMAAG